MTEQRQVHLFSSSWLDTLDIFNQPITDFQATYPAVSFFYRLRLFTYETRRQKSLNRATFPALFCSLLLVALAGCWRKPESQTAATESGTKTRQEIFKTANAASVQIFADDPVWRPPHAVIGGTVQNTSRETLKDLIVEIELKRRGDGGVERREAKVEPAGLAPGEKGRYSLKVVREEWSGSQVVRLSSSSRTGEIAFKTLPGMRRPPERIPEPTPITRVVQAPRPKPKTQGEEFINTPDNPERVP